MLHQYPKVQMLLNCEVLRTEVRLVLFGLCVNEFLRTRLMTASVELKFIACPLYSDQDNAYLEWNSKDI